MTAFGKPPIQAPRARPDGNVDARGLGAALQAIDQRLRTIEAALIINPDVTIQQALRAVLQQPDGIVVKRNGGLTTRTLTSGDGVTVTNGNGVDGDPKISAP